MLDNLMKYYTDWLSEMYESGASNQIIVTELVEDIYRNIGLENQLNWKNTTPEQDVNYSHFLSVLHSYRKLITFFDQQIQEIFQGDAEKKVESITDMEPNNPVFDEIIELDPESGKIVAIYSKILIEIKREIARFLDKEFLATSVVSRQCLSVYERSLIFWYRYIDKKSTDTYENYVENSTDIGQVSYPTYARIAKDCEWLHNALFEKLSHRDYRRLGVLSSLVKSSSKPEKWLSLLKRAEGALLENNSH